MDPYELTIAQAMEEMSTGALTAVELTKSCLARIDEIDSKLQAFITLDIEGAIKQALSADKKRGEGKGGFLCGIPLSVKDILCTKNLKTTCGSRILENYIPPYDATVVEKIKTEDGVVLGKVAMDEFAMGSTSEMCAFGIPQNPHRKGYIAGGSSGGSAVSVASQECLGSLGSDTGGSVRQPASLCGVVGMKPTYGRVSRYGLTAFASSLDQVGPLSRDVTDCAILMNVISGYDTKDSTSVQQFTPDLTLSLKKGVGGIRVGVPEEYFNQGLDPEVERIIQNGIEILKDGGAELVPISLPHTEYCVAVYYIIASSEASSNLARYDGALYGYRDQHVDSLLDMYKQTRSKGFGAEVKRRILIGTYALSSGYYDAYYKKASQVRTLILGDYKDAFNKCDVLISPVTPTPAWKIGEKSENPLAMYLSDILTSSANLAGIPGMSVPGGFTEKGLPVGIQLQANHFKEEVLIKTAFHLEQDLDLGPANLDI